MMRKVLILAISPLLLFSQSKLESSYSSIAQKDCKLVETYEMDMGAAVSCKKFADIEVEINDYDARMSLTLYRKNRIYPLRFSSAVTPSLSALGNKIEWRHPKGKNKTPKAMIVRLNANEWNEKSQREDKKISYLVVSKITDKEICVVGKIKAQKNQNILARQMADKAKSMPCVLKQEAPKKIGAIDYKSFREKAKTQEDFNYFKSMGPIEQSLRMLKKPKFPIWRVRLKLYPKFSKRFPSLLGGYKVVVERVNLSSLLYKELIPQYGKENVDERLNNYHPSERYVLNYDVIQYNPSMFNEESNTYEVFTVNNIQLEEHLNGEWGKNTTVMLEKAPWESKLNPFPSMVRALAQKAGWFREGGLYKEWSTQEIPEGISENRPWLEVVLENQVGNGGGYVATWHDLVADDSIAQVLYSIYYDSGYGDSIDKAQISTAVICGRGENTTVPTQMCN